jgi:hypothetical protein
MQQKLLPKLDKKIKFFEQSIKSEETRRVYTPYLQKYLQFPGSTRMTGHSNPRKIEEHMISNRNRKKQVFRQKLGKNDRKIFDQMFSYSRLYNSAGSNACRPILIHPILMSIIFEHYKQLKKLMSSQ